MEEWRVALWKRVSRNSSDCTSLYRWHCNHRGKYWWSFYRCCLWNVQEYLEFLVTNIFLTIYILWFYLTTLFFRLFLPLISSMRIVIEVKPNLLQPERGSRVLFVEPQRNKSQTVPARIRTGVVRTGELKRATVLLPRP